MEKALATSILELLSKLDPGMLAVLFVIMLVSPFLLILFVSYSMIRLERCNAAMMRAHEKETGELLRAYREDTKAILECYGKDMSKLSGYYNDNVELVHSWRRIAEGFQQTVVLNTATMQRINDMIETVLRNK